jgi:hypothetical protein
MFRVDSLRTSKAHEQIKGLIEALTVDIILTLKGQ